MLASEFDQIRMRGWIWWRAGDQKIPPKRAVARLVFHILTATINKESFENRFPDFRSFSDRRYRKHPWGYHITNDTAHTVLARECITVLPQLDERVDKKCVRPFPLAFYAAKSWVDDSKFEDMTSRIQDAMGLIFKLKLIL